MIIVINSQGKVVTQQYENIFQGSNKVNVVNLLAPFSSNVIFKASFELPDGTIKPENLDGYTMTPSLKITDDLNSWRLPIEFPISQHYGVISMQLRGYIGEEIVCSSLVKIPVHKGIPYDKDTDIEPSQYDELLQLIQDLTARLSDKVDIVNNTYEIASEVNEDTVGVYYVYDSENGVYNVKYLPENYEQNVTYFRLISTGRVANNSNGVYLEFGDENQKVKFDITKEKVTINGVQVITFDDLIAQNVKYDNSSSGLNSNNAQEVIDELKNIIDNIKNSQVVEIGELTITPSEWVKNQDNIYEYKFKNSAFKEALIQAPIITPNDETINNLNANNILVYPQIDVYQEDENVAVAIIRVDTLPTFNFVASVKLQGTVVTAETSGIKASYILFDENQNIPVKNVQKAIEKVQTNLETFNATYNQEKLSFITTDANGKIPASLLPSYVDDVIEGYLHQTVFYETRTGAGTEEEPYEYSNAITPLSGKIYVDLTTEKTYRWSGTQYTIIKGDLRLGTTNGTAYDGASGQANRNDIDQIINGQKVVGKCQTLTGNIEQNVIGVTQNVDDNSTKIATTEFVKNALNDYNPKETLLETDTPVKTFDFANSNLKHGDELEIHYKIYGDDAVSSGFVGEKIKNIKISNNISRGLFYQDLNYNLIFIGRPVVEDNSVLVIQTINESFTIYNNELQGKIGGFNIGNINYSYTQYDIDVDGSITVSHPGHVYYGITAIYRTKKGDI